MKRIRVDQLPLEGDVELSRETAHHLVNVMRLASGARVVTYDGQGAQQPALLTVGEAVRVTATGPVEHTSRGPALHLVVSVLKHQAMDLALRMATETGASTLHPVLMDRTVARGDRADRWQRILTSAASQCGRADVPKLLPVRPLLVALDQLDVPIVYGHPGASAARPCPQDVAFVVGPAGGLSPAECTALNARGAVPIGLGPHVLRAETACAVGIGLIRAT